MNLHRTALVETRSSQSPLARGLDKTQSRDTPGAQPCYRALITSPPLAVNRARKATGLIVDLRNRVVVPSANSTFAPPECGLTRRGSGRFRSHRRSSGLVHGTKVSASKTRIVFDVPSVISRMSTPRRGLERRIDACHVDLRPDHHQVSRSARPPPHSPGTFQFRWHLWNQRTIVGTIPGLVQVEPFIKRLVAQIRKNSDPPAQKRHAILADNRRCRKVVVSRLVLMHRQANPLELDCTSLAPGLTNA